MSSAPVSDIKVYGIFGYRRIRKSHTQAIDNSGCILVMRYKCKSSIVVCIQHRPSISRVKLYNETHRCSVCIERSTPNIFYSLFDIVSIPVSLYCSCCHVLWHWFYEWHITNNRPVHVFGFTIVSTPSLHETDALLGTVPHNCSTVELENSKTATSVLDHVINAKPRALSVYVDVPEGITE